MTPLKINDESLLFFLADIAMLSMVVANLSLIIFDWHFEYEFVQTFFRTYLPAFFSFYNDTIHRYFFLIDWLFVSVFMLELGIRWGIAILQKTHSKWFFYPFIHWYDVIGCIPVSSFRFFRILRIVSIVMRLQRMGLIDIRKTYVYQQVSHFFDIFVEEVSDRVVVNVIQGLQSEIQKGHPITHSIINDVLKPQRPVLMAWAAERIQNMALESYQVNRHRIRLTITTYIEDAIAKNQEINTIEKIPVFGDIVRSTLQSAICDIVFSVLDRAFTELTQDNTNQVITEVSDIIANALLSLEEDKELNKITSDILNESLYIIKQQVEVKQWKIREAERKAEKQRQKEERKNFLKMLKDEENTTE